VASLTCKVSQNGSHLPPDTFLRDRRSALVKSALKPQLIHQTNIVRFPQYLREKVQSSLTLLWTFRAPLIQKASPARLVATTLYQNLSDNVTNYTYVDFCAGAGGPTPFIEKDLNAQLSARIFSSPSSANSKPNDLIPRSPRTAAPSTDAVKFVLTDLHPHIPDWTEASKRSENLTFVSEPVDAANAPAHLNGQEGKKIFRLYNLAFHHFDDNLGSDILRNTLETADGFGYVLHPLLPSRPSC
jgi:hypothetical protein